ncbi:GerAB/ArcD/ProY family transporter [Paenibacillus azoreducens]|uniref:Germination protein n=1 Tax=Paenibacillus azoreducens TaxID=116718 RepID=A0A919Y5L0_9BACL|nr:endospore germination permease [Paenibacillus azoreducens]GIO45351.1 germination protein [Paenibacillus azoreducens]
MLEKGRISTRQFAVLIFLACVGDMILLFPSAISFMASQDAWMASLIGVPAGVLVLWLMLRVSFLYPDKTLIEISRLVLGKWLGTFVSLWYLFFFFMLCSYVIREVADFMSSQIFMNTPIPIIYLLFLLLMVYAAQAGLESIGRSSEVVLPIFLLFVIGFICFLLPQSNGHYLKPFLENGAVPVLHGALFSAIYPFAELIIFLMVISSVKRSPHFRRDVLLAAAGGGLILSLIVLVSWLVIGSNLTVSSTYPTFTLAQKINIGNFLQRIESTIAIAWLMSSFYKAVICYYSFVLGVAQLTGLRNHKVLYFPAAIMLFGMAQLGAPDIIYYLKHLIPYWMDWDITHAVVIPCILLAAAAWRKRRKAKHS